MSVYLGWRGLDDSRIGWVMSIGGVSALLIPTIMSLLADLKLENRVLLRCTFLSAAAALGLMLLTGGFWWLIPAFLVWALAMAPMMSLVDGLLFSVRGLREAEGKPTPPYHRVRVFGTLGFIAPSFVLYWLMKGGDASLIQLAPACALVVALIAAANTFLLPHTRGSLGETTTPIEVPDPHPPAKDGDHMPTKLALKCMLQPDMALFCLTMWLAHVATAAYYTFYPLYLTRVIQVKEEWIGLISSVGVTFEIAYVLLFGWLLRKLGARWLLMFGIAAVGLRLALLWLAPTLFVAVGTQLLHGLTVLALFVLPPLYLNHRAEPAFRNSIQGLYAMVVFGSGRIVGNIFAGQVSTMFDGDILVVFGIATGIAAGAFVLHALFFRDRSGKTIEP